MRQRFVRLRSRDAAGAATLEYVGAFALVSVIVGSMMLSTTSTPFADIAERAICSVKAAAGGAACAPDEDPEPPTEPPFDPKPEKCKVAEHSEKVNAEIKIAFIKIGENAGLVRTTYSDGTVTFTATDGAGLGATTGAGAKFDVGKLEGGEQVDFGAGLKYEYGSTWTFKDADEADAMEKQLNDYLAEQAMLRHDSSGGYAVGLAIKGFTKPPKPPNMLVSTFEVNTDGGYTVGLSLPFNTTPNADPKGPKIALGDYGIKFGQGHRWTQIKNTETDTTTWTTSGEYFGQSTGTVGPVAGDYKDIIGSSMAITRDKDGNITNVTMVTTREGKASITANLGQKDQGGKVSGGASDSELTVTTASLNVKTDAQRALVNEWLEAQADPTKAVSPETYFPDVLVPDDPFQNLMYTNATVSNVQYDNVTDKVGFAAEVKLGVALGVDFSLETTDSEVADATYLDAPGADGVRPPVEFAECVAQ